MNQFQSNSDNWFVCPQARPGAEMRLFLFPYAGGGPTAFWKWGAKLPDHIETWITHYPGRGSRYNEAPVKKLSLLVEGIYQAIHPLLDKPFAFFGHSLGSLIAFELTRSLQQKDLPQPIVLFISACMAPQLPDPDPHIHGLSDPEFVKALQELNGTPKEIITNPKLMKLLLPTLRADFEAAENYQYNQSEHPLACPIVAFGGSDDPHVSQEGLAGWGSQTSSRFKSISFPGDHFYLNAAEDEVVQLIAKEMMYSRSVNHNPR